MSRSLAGKPVSRQNLLLKRRHFCSGVHAHFALLAILSSAYLALLPTGASAEPMSIGLRRMVNRCDVIAVARFSSEHEPDWKSHGVELEFIRVLKGNVEPGKYKVKVADRPWVRKEAPEFVAFFRKDLC